MRRIAQRLLVPVTDQQRAERSARALAFRIAADDEIGGRGRLDLEPRRRATAGFVTAFLALADHALEAARERRGAERDPVIGNVHELDVRGWQQALGEIATPIAIARIAQIDTGEVQQIEAVEDDRRCRIGGRDLAFCLELRSFLQRAERRLAAGVERDELAVEDHAVHRLLSQLRRQLWKLGRELEAPPRAQLDAAVVDEGEHPIAVELGFPHPVRAMERRVAGFGEHRCKLGRHRLDFPCGREPRGSRPRHRKKLELADAHPRQHRAVVRRHVRFDREPVLVLDQQPLIRFLRAHQRERALDLLAAQQDAQLAFRQAVANLALGARTIVKPGRASFVGRVDAAVPDDHLAGAILAGGNHAFERGIVVRMIFDMHSEPLFVTIERRSLGHGPGQQDTVAFEPEVVVQPGGGMLLDHEQQRPAPHGGQRRRRLGRGRERALGRVFAENFFRHAGFY